MSLPTEHGAPKNRALPAWSIVGCAAPVLFTVAAYVYGHLQPPETPTGWSPFKSWFGVFMKIIIAGAIIGTIATLIAICRRERPMWIRYLAVILNMPLDIIILHDW